MPSGRFASRDRKTAHKGRETSRLHSHAKRGNESELKICINSIENWYKYSSEKFSCIKKPDFSEKTGFLENLCLKIYGNVLISLMLRSLSKNQAVILCNRYSGESLNPVISTVSGYRFSPV